MNRIFFRIVPLIMVAIAVAAVAIYFAIRYMFGDPLEDIARKQASGPIFLLEQYIDQAPADEWLVRLNKVREVSGFSMELIPLQAVAELDVGNRQLLDRGGIVLDIPNKALLRRVDLSGERYIGSAEDVLLIRGLPIDIGLELRMDAIRYLIVALCVLVPIGVWSRTHWQELLALSRVADRFGEGHLSVRADANSTSSVYPLATRLNDMASRIENLLEAHRTLLHSVSHELRTPISRMEFGLELIRNAASKEEREARIEAMEGDVHELNALVNELLDLAKLDRQQAVQMASFQLAGMLHEAVDKLAHALTGKELAVKVAQEVGNVIGNRHLLSRAVGNLLLNAAKYAGQVVAITACGSPEGWITIVVEDDGPGVPADERDKVFEPFYRLDRSRDRATGGFGLGLTIARKAVALHHGELTVTESPLGGARFMLMFPTNGREQQMLRS